MVSNDGIVGIIKTGLSDLLVLFSKIIKFCRLFATEKSHFPLQMDPFGKIAIITGGETGIGLAAAQNLLSNGAKVKSRYF